MNNTESGYICPMKYFGFFILVTLVIASCHKSSNDPGYADVEKKLLGKWYLQKVVDSEGYWDNGSFDTTVQYTGYGSGANLNFSPNITTNYGYRGLYDSCGLGYYLSPADVATTSFMHTNIWRISASGTYIYWYFNGTDSLFIKTLTTDSLVLEHIAVLSANDTIFHGYWYFTH